MKFDIAKSQCLVVPPYAAAGIYMYFIAFYADRYKNRCIGIIVNACLCILGLGLLGLMKNNGVRYFGVFLATMGANTNIPTILTYQANNIRGQWKRAFCSATLVGFGGVGGIIGSTVFRQQDAPEYKWGIVTCMLANALIIVVTAVLTFKFIRANKRVDRGRKMIKG